MLSKYYTVKGYGEHETVIQKSRFITYLNRATTEEDAQAFIQEIKKQHRNANHNCSAYIIGEHDHIQKANDDGEPSGTAGVPMLEVLKKKGLKDTVVVVTRYFGGIKLGAGGLIRAYGKGVSEGLLHTGIVERTLKIVMHIKFDYPHLGKVENDLRTSGTYDLLNILYNEKVEILILIELEEQERFVEHITNLLNGKVDISKGEMRYSENIVEI
ncbi:YigZ family protein [Sutcliffiella deserti]|uniref:YigZ family protein n=1 Tax=Sutcliffiella deserti TaxID=2875501 RepID=UPI001CBB88E0|nr:YigZ family protein [Sutcliffiella deserti]